MIFGALGIVTKLEKSGKVAPRDSRKKIKGLCPEKHIVKILHSILDLPGL